MKKTQRTNNNFIKWIFRSVPYLLIVFFVFINVAVFNFQPNSYYLQQKSGWQSDSRSKTNTWLFFDDVYFQKTTTELGALLSTYYSLTDRYPVRLKDIGLGHVEKNWIYNPSFKNYDLIYRIEE